VLSSYYLRAPLFSLDTLFHFLEELNFELLVKNKVFLEAIYIASPAVYDPLMSFLNGNLKDPKKEKKLKLTLLKYLIRMCVRPTPFGLFSGCALGSFQKKTGITLDKLENYRRTSNLDMMLLDGIKQELLKIDAIRKNLKFYPNNSLYDLGDNYLRYVEYRFVNNHRMYDLQELEHSIYISKVLENTKNGKSIDELSQTLIDEEVDISEAKEFIEELILNQLLVSEIEPTTTGVNYLTRLIAILEKNNDSEEIVVQIKRIKNLITAIDQQFGNQIKTYEILFDELKKIKPNVSKKNIFQSDVFLTTSENTVSYKVKKDLQKALNFFSKINENSSNDPLFSFKEAFLKRYGDESLPLSIVLDTEIGIGYGTKKGVESNLLKNLDLQPKLNFGTTVVWSDFDELIFKSFLNCLKSNEKVIQLKFADFKHLASKTNDFPLTFSAIVEIYKEGEEDILFFNSAGGATATHFMGRFSQNDPEINDFLLEIASIEEELQPNCIFAEIVHLPQSRTGNILNISKLRAYEIPYLGFSSLDSHHQIPVDDLLVSVKNNRIVLISKTLNKEIIPRLDNAHNHSMGALAVYEFLCDLQYQGIQKTIGFKWNTILQTQPFLPRVELDGIIISKARWNFETKEFIDFYEKNRGQLQEKYKLPRRVELVDGDNRLMIDLENEFSILLMIDTIKKIDSFGLEEFLFETKKSPVCRGSENFCNQLVVSFSKEMIP